MAATMSAGQITQVRVTGGVEVLAALWLLAAPFALNYSANGGSLPNDAILGVAVLLLAIVQMTGGGSLYRASWASWLSGLAGLWLIAAPFVLGYPAGSAALWSDVATGVVLAVMAAVTTMGTPEDEYS